MTHVKQDGQEEDKDGEHDLEHCDGSTRGFGTVAVDAVRGAQRGGRIERKTGEMSGWPDGL